MVPFESTTIDVGNPLVAPRNFTAKPGNTAARAVKLPSRRTRERSREVIAGAGKAGTMPAPAGEIQGASFRLLRVLDESASGDNNRPPLAVGSSFQPVSRGRAVWERVGL